LSIFFRRDSTPVCRRRPAPPSGKRFPRRMVGKTGDESAFRREVLQGHSGRGVGGCSPPQVRLLTCECTKQRGRHNAAPAFCHVLKQSVPANPAHHGGAADAEDSKD